MPLATHITNEDKQRILEQMELLGDEITGLKKSVDSYQTKIRRMMLGYDSNLGDLHE